MGIEKLDRSIRDVCPIDGVSSAGRIDFRAEATSEQRAAATAILSEWDCPAKCWRAGSRYATADAVRERNAALDHAGQLAAIVATTTDPTLLLLLGIIEEIIEELRWIKAGKPKASREMPQLIADVVKRLQAKKV